MSEQPKRLVSIEESSRISRVLRAWLNQYEDKPLNLEFEWLDEDEGLCLSVMQAAYKTKQFIMGGYEAQYQFKLIYRTTAVNADERLEADETLNKFAAWAENERPFPEIAENIRVKKIQIDSASSMFARYDGDVEDHQILMTLIYEVI